MKRFCAIGLAAVTALALVGCSEASKPAPDTRAADEKTIRDGEVAWNADWKDKDAARIMSHYADSATLMVPGVPLAKGKDAIRGLLEPMLADKNLSLQFAATAVEVSKGGDIAYSQGTYTLTSTNPTTRRPATETGKYVTVYQKQADGSWKAVEDINSPDAPPAPVAAAKPARAGKGRRRK